MSKNGVIKVKQTDDSFVEIEPRTNVHNVFMEDDELNQMCIDIFNIPVIKYVININDEYGLIDNMTNNDGYVLPGESYENTITVNYEPVSINIYMGEIGDEFLVSYHLTYIHEPAIVNIPEVTGDIYVVVTKAPK